MFIVDFFLAAAFAAAPAPAAPALPTREQVGDAYRTAKDSVVNANLLMTSAQARLERLQLAFGEAGEAGSRGKAKASFERLTAKLSSFRTAADALDARRPHANAEAPAPSGLAAASPVQEPTADLLSQIAELRKGYDPATRRASAERVQRALEGFPGLPELERDQENALAAGRAIAKQVREDAKSLSPKRALKPAPAARKASTETRGLADDAAALEVELRLLGARYRLDSLLRKHPELGGA